MNLTLEEKITIDTYDETASYRMRTRSNFDFCKEEILEFSKYLKSGKIIDVGCGTGRDYKIFHDLGFEYIGVDLSSGLLASAKESFPEADFRKMSLYTLNFPDNYFDGLWAFASYLHIPKAKIDFAIEEAKRVLKSGGIGFIAVKRGKGEQLQETLGGKRFFSYYQLEEFEGVLARNGLKTLEASVKSKENVETKTAEYIIFYFQKA